MQKTIQISYSKPTFDKNNKEKNLFKTVDIPGPFSTAIIDPPWPYRKVNGTDNHLQGFMQHEGKADGVKYHEMAIDRLEKLPVGRAVGGYLFLWTVPPYLQAALNLIETWGFKYISFLAWHKAPGLGVGYNFRGDFELCLFAKNERMPSIRTNVSSFLEVHAPYFEHKRIGHSSKPENIHTLVEQCYPGEYLELFGRNKREGWTVLGNQTECDCKTACEHGEDIFVSLERLLEPQCS